MPISNIKQVNEKRYVVKIIHGDLHNTQTVTQRWKVLTTKELTKDLDPRDVLEVYELGKQCTVEVTIR